MDGIHTSMSIKKFKVFLKLKKTSPGFFTATPAKKERKSPLINFITRQDFFTEEFMHVQETIALMMNGPTWTLPFFSPSLVSLGPVHKLRHLD